MATSVLHSQPSIPFILLRPSRPPRERRGVARPLAIGLLISLILGLAVGHSQRHLWSARAEERPAAATDPGRLAATTESARDEAGRTSSERALSSGALERRLDSLESQITGLDE